VRSRGQHRDTHPHRALALPPSNENKQHPHHPQLLSWGPGQAGAEPGATPRYTPARALALPLSKEHKQRPHQPQLLSWGPGLVRSRERHRDTLLPGL